MTLLAYIFKNVFRNGRRTLLTGLSLAVSMALVCVLQTILLEITKPANLDESVPRIVIRHRTALTLSLPKPYGEKIERVPHIKAVAPFVWFGGIWKDTEFSNFFPRFATDPHRFFDVWIDFKPIDPKMLDDWKATRTGAMVGRILVERHGFKVGDTVPVQGDIFPVDLELKIVGIFDGQQPDFMVFRLDYLDELMGETVRPGSFFALVDDPSKVDETTALLEEMFRNSTSQVKAETEKAFQLSFVEMLGNIKVFINSLVSVVVFAVLMIAASTMALAIRERTREIATLKAIGFTRTQVMGLVVGEGLLVSLLGGGGGLLLSYFVFPDPRLFAAVGAGLFAAAGVGLPTLLLALLLPEVGRNRLSRMLARIRTLCSVAGPRLTVLVGGFVTVGVLYVVPSLDWFTFSGGMIQSMNVRLETLQLGAGIILLIGLGSSLWPAWSAARMSVLDGLRTLE